MFIGSGTLIKTTGPAAFVTSALTGAIIVLVMRMLAEMAVARPSTGSFADYARDALGDWAGFSVGWLYWYFWVVVVAMLAYVVLGGADFGAGSDGGAGVSMGAVGGFARNSLRRRR